MGNSFGETAAEHHRAAITIDEACSRAMAACVDMIDAAVAIGARGELHAVRYALQTLHEVGAATFEETSRTMQN